MGDVLIILRGDGSRRRQKLAAVLHDERAVLGQLLVVGVQQHIAVWRNIVAFSRAFFWAVSRMYPPQRHKVGPVDLAQCGIHKPPPSVRAALDQPQQVRLKDDGLKVPASAAARPTSAPFNFPVRPGRWLCLLPTVRRMDFSTSCVSNAPSMTEKSQPRLISSASFDPRKLLPPVSSQTASSKFVLPWPFGAAQHGQVRVGCSSA